MIYANDKARKELNVSPSNYLPTRLRKLLILTDIRLIKMFNKRKNTSLKIKTLYFQ